MGASDRAATAARASVAGDPAEPARRGPARVVRIGVTGHRALAEPDEVERVVDGTLDDLGAAHGDDVTLVVVSSLAEGADRLVADRVLDRGGRLEAVLPLPPDDYRRDFLTPASLGAFDALLERADTVAVAGPTLGLADGGDAARREVAYEAAGRAVVERCDVLLALWDGAPSRGRGGTAEIVGHARDAGRRVVVVPVRRSEAR